MSVNPIVASSVIQGGSNIAEGMLGFASNVYTNKMNRKLQNEQNDYNLKMWHLNNQYNTPAAQVQRYKDAGLNPNLMNFGGTTGISSSPAASSQSHPLESFQPDLSTFGSSLANVIRLKMEQRVAESEANKNDAEAQKSISESVGQNITNSHLDSTLTAQYNQIQANIKMTDAKILEIDQRVENFRQQNKLLDKKIEGEELENRVRLVNARIAEATEQTKIDLAIEELNIAKEQKEVLRAQKKQISALAYLYTVQAVYTEKQQEIAEKDFKIREKLSDQELENLKQKLTNLKSENSNIQADTNLKNEKSRLTKKEADTYIFRMVVDSASKVVDSGAKVVDTFKPF